MATISDPTKYPWYTLPDNSFSPFSGIFVNTDFVSESIYLTVVLNLVTGFPGNDLGTIKDPDVPNIPAGTTFSEPINAADLANPSHLLQRLVYTPPNFTSGQSTEVRATIYVSPGPYFFPGYPYPAIDTASLIDTVTAPRITGTTANQPASTFINPFGAVTIIDNDFKQTAQDIATITITDDDGKPTDNLGGLRGAGFLGQTGVGTYTITATSPTTLTTELHSVSLLVPDVSGTQTAHLELDVTDVPPNSASVPPSNASAAPPDDFNLTSKDTTTSVIEIGPLVTVSISGTPQEGQTLTAISNNANVVFHWQRSPDGKTWTDISGALGSTYMVAEADENDVIRALAFTSPSSSFPSDPTVKITDVPPKLTVTITGGTQEGSTLTASPTLTTDSDNSTKDVTYQWQRSADSGKTWSDIGGATGTTYKTVAADDNDLIRNEASFTDDTGQSVKADGAPPIGPIGNDNGDHRPPMSSDRFQVQHMSDGQPPRTVMDSWSSNGDPYNGPVVGIERQWIVTSDIINDNLNINPTGPSVFIHTGSGDDAINMSGIGGSNILDGSFGSNFMTGGTGHDEFYVDDRGPTAPIWTTVQGMHSGDLATIWGITRADFNAMTEGNDVLPVAPGLDFSLLEPGKQAVNLTLTGYHTSDLPASMGGNGRLGIVFGTIEGNDYMQIHAN